MGECATSAASCVTPPPMANRPCSHKNITMNILLTGASGEIGRPTVARLLEAGHNVRCAVRGTRAARIVAELGADPVSVDLFDARAVRDAVGDADAVLHYATAIPPVAAMGDLAAWVDNDRLREETTAYLADAVVANGTRALQVQSYFAARAPRGAQWIDEGDDRPAAGWSGIPVMDSMRTAEEIAEGVRAKGVEAVVLRFGSLYSATSEQLQTQAHALTAGEAAIFGDGSNYWPFVASGDAARAVVAALALHGGSFDVSDDEPVTLAELWSGAAAALGAPAPPRGLEVDGPMADVLLGSWRVSNRAFKAATGWSPRTPAVVDGWPAAARRYLAERPGLRPR